MVSAVLLPDEKRAILLQVKKAVRNHNNLQRPDPFSGNPRGSILTSCEL
jgi:hypothetical protein